MGEEPGLLNHVAHVPAELDGIGVGHVVPVEEDPARGGLDEPVDHLQGRRLAATRGAHEDADLVARNLERELAHGDRTVGIGLADPIETDHRHDHFGVIARSYPFAPV